jgi:hypothetical protein
LFLSRYRAGQWDKALGQTPAAFSGPCPPAYQLAWALALHRAGRVDEARAKYAAAADRRAAAMMYGGDAVEFLTLFEEAEAALGRLPGLAPPREVKE